MCVIHLISRLLLKQVNVEDRVESIADHLGGLEDVRKFHSSYPFRTWRACV